MKCFKWKNITILMLAVIFAILINGCDQNKKDEDDELSMPVSHTDEAVREVFIHETGGEDGRNIEWRVYSENGKYFLSYSGSNCQPLSHDYGLPLDGEFEITEQEYKTIMDADYNKFIAEYDADYQKNIVDSVCFRSVLKYDNGSEINTEANMTSVAIKLIDLARKYSE